MTIFRRSTPTEQYRLRLTRAGILAEYRRVKVGGGYYTRTSITIPWWVR